MKGLVFTEFLEMVEDLFGDDVADNIIEASDLPSGGAYTAVGTYDHGEIVQLVTHLSTETGMSIPDLLKAYGKHLFGRFSAGYQHFFADVATLFDFLKSIHGYIHVEVHKLYPDAELPHIACEQISADQLSVVYRSDRPFADFAEGLLLGAVDHFAEPVNLERIKTPEDSAKSATFLLTKTEA
ncbi:MAG: heme NO-binding domain-containing protein [Anaerolineae bacterium]